MFDGTACEGGHAVGHQCAPIFLPEQGVGLARLLQGFIEPNHALGGLSQVVSFLERSVVGPAVRPS